MKTYQVISFLIAFSLCSYAQTYVLQGYIENLDERELFLSAYQKGEFKIIDRTGSAAGSFLFVLSDASPPGLYALELKVGPGSIESAGRIRILEFIFNRENIEVNASDMNDILGSGGISNSLENAVYYEYQEVQDRYRDSVRVAYSDFLEAQVNNKGVNEARLRFIALQQSLDDYLVQTAASHPELFVSRILKASRFPIIDTEQGGWEAFKVRFFENSPMDDTLMLNHPLYLLRINDFLSLFHLGSPRDTIVTDEAYFEAVNIIMANVSSEPDLRTFIAEYLMGIFGYYDHETVEAYIADNYLDEQCESDLVELVHSRMEGYKKMRPGKKAPDIVIRDRYNKIYTLSRLENDYILVMFWASTCEHCEKMILKLHEWYQSDNRPDIEVVAISVDTSRYHWEAFMDEHRLTWISAFDPDGWMGKVPEAYNVYATPSVFLLDSKRRIIAKPLTYREFLRSIRKL